MSASDSTACAGAHETGASTDTGASGGATDCVGGKRASPEPDAAELVAAKQQNRGEGASAAPCSRCGEEFSFEDYPASRRLVPMQRALLGRVLGLLDSSRDSVVITNPLEKNAIVYVTQAWQAMCGYSASEAVGQNPRLTQGEGTDRNTVRSMEHAVRHQQSCKVRVVNYRGHSGEPFWNCITMHPILFRNQTVLFMARLQDYSHRMNKMVSFVPSQFCKANDQLQCTVDLGSMHSAASLSQPCRIKMLEVDGVSVGGGEGESESSTSGIGGGGEDSSAAAAAAPPGAGAPRVPTRHVKRLGFTGMALEPEYLADRIRDECANLEWPCQATEMISSGAEVIRLEMIQKSASGGEHDRLHAFLHIMPEDTQGKYLVSFTRLSGDTFQFHALFRELRRRLADLEFSPLSQKC